MDMKLNEIRHTEYEIAPLFRDRWSPRAMSGEALGQGALMSLFEAARWAPSSYNNQPWRFLYAHRDSEQWPLFFDLLVEFNRMWAKDAAVLVVVCAKKTFDNGEPSVTYQYDAGAAWENLALQASMHGLVAHGMQGFDYDKARTALDVPQDHDVLAMAALGHPGRREDLPEPLREKEVPSTRRPLDQIVLEGGFE